MSPVADKKYTILYVDDEASNLRVFKNTFRREFHIMLAESAKEAVALLRKHTVDLIITDQMMPEMSGVELLREIKELFPDVPPSRVMISGYAAAEDIERAYDEFRLHKFIRKPWEEKELKALMIETIEANID